MKLIFSSSVADVALWLGPYMSISSRMQFVQGPHRSRNEGKSHQTKKPTNQPDDPQIPQPDLRFVKRNNKPDTQKGPEPKQKHPQKRFAKGHSGLTTVSLSKPCENEKYNDIQADQAECLPVYTGRLCLSQRPLKSACYGP